MLEEATNFKSLQEKHDEEERWRKAGRRHAGLTAACAALALAIGGAGWYAYPRLQRSDASVDKTNSFKQAVDAIGKRVDQEKAALSQWVASKAEVQNEVAGLKHEIRSRVEAAKKQASQTADALLHRVEAQESQMADVKTKTAELESFRENDRQQIAALETELGQVRHEMTAQTEELSQVRKQIAEKDAGTNEKLAALQAGTERNQQGVDAISNKLAVRRIDFEVTKGHSRELAPGISIGITGTDVAYRRVTGWMWVLPDRRTIWLRGQGAQEPVTYYGMNDGKKRELVITSVTNKAAIGYLLLPGDAGASEAAEARPAARLEAGSAASE